MKYTFIAAVAALAFATPAFAQTTTVVPAPGGGGVVTTSPRAGAAVTIAPDQRTRIKQYVVTNKVKPYAMRADNPTFHLLQIPLISGNLHGCLFPFYLSPFLLMYSIKLSILVVNGPMASLEYS